MTSPIDSHSVKQTNIILIPQDNIDIARVDTRALKAALVDVYEEDTKPLIAEYPGVFVLTDPISKILVNILADQNRIIISDANVTRYTGRASEKFLEFVPQAVRIIFTETDKESKAYGLNITSDIDLTEADSGAFLKNHFIDSSTNLENGTIESAGLKLVYKKDGIRYELKLDPRVEAGGVPTQSIYVEQNAHFPNKFPGAEDFMNQFTSFYRESESVLKEILA